MLSMRAVRYTFNVRRLEILFLTCASNFFVLYYRIDRDEVYLERINDIKPGVLDLQINRSFIPLLLRTLELT